jgi:hypothetical protein
MIKKTFTIEGLPVEMLYNVRSAVTRQHDIVKDIRGRKYLNEILEILDKKETELTANQYFAILQAMGNHSSPYMTDTFKKMVLEKKALKVFKGLGD